MEYITINSIDYSEAELRKLWLEEYCNQEVITFDGIKVKFFEDKFDQIGRAHVRTPVTAHYIVCRLLLEIKKISRFLIFFP